jgi:hypothetical protein
MRVLRGYHARKAHREAEALANDAFEKSMSDKG